MCLIPYLHTQISRIWVFPHKKGGENMGENPYSLLCSGVHPNNSFNLWYFRTMQLLFILFCLHHSETQVIEHQNQLIYGLSRSFLISRSTWPKLSYLPETSISVHFATSASISSDTYWFNSFGCETDRASGSLPVNKKCRVQPKE